MLKPYPIVFAPKKSDQEKLVRALHRMGYRFRTMFSQDKDEDQTWISWNSSSIELYPYVFIEKSGRMSACIKPEQYASHIPVNSISHFLAYARTLGAPPS